MTTVASLRRQVTTLQARVNEQHAPRQWCFVGLEEGEELPARVLSKIGEHDHVYIRYIACGYLRGMRQGDWSWGYVIGPGGTSIIKPDGSLQKVRER